MRITLAILSTIAALGFIFALGHILGAQNATNGLLIGLGCDGAGGPLYAREESDFPLCKTIYRESE